MIRDRNLDRIPVRDAPEIVQALRLERFAQPAPTALVAQPRDHGVDAVRLKPRRKEVFSEDC